MSKRLYKYLSLVGAKLVGRRHPRDVDLPGLKELKNAFVSKSDSAITCRPDFDPISEDLPAFSDKFVWNTNDNQDDYLNSATGMYGSDNLILMSKIAPISYDGSTSSIACSKYSTGTVTGANGQKTITGSGTEWNESAWPGCFIEIDGDGKYYKIDAVNSNTSLTVTEDLASSSSYSADSYNIFRTHQTDFADYKLNLQSFTSGMIYSSPTISLPLNSNKICGPFYASTMEITTETGWAEFEDDDVEVNALISATAASYMEQVATDGTNWMCIPGKLSGSVVLCKSDNPTSDWESVALPVDFTPYGSVFCYNSRFYIVGEQTSTGNAAYAYTTDVGTSWTTKVNSSVNGSFISLAASSGTVVALADSSGGFGLGNCYYTTDDGGSWAKSSSINMTTSLLAGVNVYYLNGKFLIAGINAGIFGFYSFSTDGVTFESKGSGPYQLLLKCSYSWTADLWCFTTVLGDGICSITDLSLGGALTFSPFSGAFAGASGIVFAGDRFLIGCAAGGVASTANGLTFTDDGATVTNVYPASGAYSSSSGETVFMTITSTIPSARKITFVVSNQTQTTTSFQSAVFEPLSDEYRALSHSILDGYVVLLGLREYSSSTNSWEYFPRRIRWSVPLTYNDFSSAGSGAADLEGSGALLDSRSVNGRIVTFESSQIGAISPRGYASDPWEYDIIKQNIRAISNPVVVDDLCYFVDDSGLLRVTNGITVESPPFSFDLTEYDDFNSDQPVWLTYAPELEALVIFNPSDANRYIYIVETEGGSVSRFQAAEVDSTDPKSVVCVENSSDRRMMVTYNPISTDTDTLVCAELSTGEVITGKDEWTSSAGDDTYHWTDVQTGEVYIVPEGSKTSIKHLIVRTYCDGTDEDTNPRLVVQCKSLEDSEWHDMGDDNGTATINTLGVNGVGTYWSNLLESSWSAGTKVFTTPWLASQCRIYLYDGATYTEQTEGTHYTVTGANEITFVTSPDSATYDLYAYSENEPSIRMTVGDMMEGTSDWFRVVSIQNELALTCDHHVPADTDTVTHHPSAAFPVGDGEIKIGLSKLVEGVKLRFLIFHRSDGDATVTKITGVSVGHVPSGEKIVEP